MAELQTQELLFLLTLPDHLRETLFVLNTSGAVTAEIVSQHTGRARAVESSYLNQLTTMGLVKKERQGRKVFFFYQAVNTELKMAIKELKALPVAFRKIVLEDTVTALHNRIKVFEHIPYT